MPFISYSQNLEDVMLWRSLQHVDRGFYIDVGAWDPREDSVTLAFYERGWRGINIEPDTEKRDALVAARPEDLTLGVAISDQPGEHVFYYVPETGLSTLDAEIAKRHQAAGRQIQERTVTVMTLREVCAMHAPQEIHFLKIDVEGLEAAVLASADFARFRPWLVVVEATEPNSPEPTDVTWESALLNVGYGLVYFDGLNRFYAADERASELAPAFSRPPNVFDDYVSAAGIRKAIATQRAGFPVAELLDASNERPVLHAELQRAVAAREDAELRALRAERDAKLAQADVERLLGRTAIDVSTVDTTNPTKPEAPEPLLSGRRRIYYDASLIIHFGLETPVGLIRTEHYVAEFLARDPTLDITFVIFDSSLGGFRNLRAAESILLRRILFHRYGQATTAPEVDGEREAESDALAPLTLAQTPRVGAEPGASSNSKFFTARVLIRRVRTALTLSPPEFRRILGQYAARLLPVTQEQGFGPRLAIRIVRRTCFEIATGIHFVIHGVTTAFRRVHETACHLVRPDLALTPDPSANGAASSASLTGTTQIGDASALDSSAGGSISFEAPAGTVQFSSGSVLLSLSNAWDYLDYTYLHRICRYDKVRFVSVIFDVIAMQFPFSTPGPSHIYHRHWVEIGHSAAHLLAISKFTADQYSEFIGRPNGLFPSMSYAHLPNFLRERVHEIGESPVQKLVGRRFVVFCSTIETRKNHYLLLQLWDRLRLEFSPDKLPTLVFVGKWGWGTETVRLLSERNYHLRNRLLILESVSDAELIWIYRNARFSLFPSLSEGYGLAAAESLSFGTPVVIANCPALVEATESLMPAYDPLDFMAWLEEMRSLIRDEGRLDELKSKATRYRGPSFEEFAAAIRSIALSVSGPEAHLTNSEQCPAA
ncbi:FkbM family methyltransferase [Bradyrhizobium sp. USDA 4532]|uniref:FkbM family methyltransferase n=1 Tax=unclassified Bradyrhizobium TaxID=2631580 RepID=UPI0020A15796|nr:MULTISPECIES: FkbM family methyltransferase [unclassified Bradyrhizobium]MCP1831710.1 FkbM family methyltransferase [Bradyrhizobium sp. USDA 4545]MCP1916547.1 FkbM family methyltransferase [Bradyrhizobium sp. USDA 4532]